MFPHIQNGKSSGISVKVSQYHVVLMSGDNGSAASSLKRDPSSNQRCISKRCGHPDVRSFGGAKCCLSCGETIASLLDEPSIAYSESSSGEDYDEDDDKSATSALDDQAWDFQVEHSSAVAIFQPPGYNEKFVRRKGSYGFRALQQDKKEIRLVLLEPGKPNDQIACSIFHTTLGSWNQPSYEAVSYTWADENGDFSFSRMLHCGKEEVPVTRNCEAALKRLRHERRQKRIWIDQLCIDQSDIAERGHQVGMMSEIYARADQVFIYLGQNINFSQDLLRYIDWFSSPHTEPVEDTIWKRDWRPDIMHVISSSWFTRVWVLQEIACAKKALLLTSDSLVPWEHFKAFIKAFQDVDPIGLTNSLPGPLNFGLRHLATTDQLFSMLISTNSCNAGDPRDKVFALSGIIMDAAHHGLIADYTKSPEQVFLETARRIVDNSAGLRILSYAKSGEHSTFDVPSWVPDWGTRRGRPLAEQLERELLKPQSRIIEYEFVPSLLERTPTFPNNFKRHHMVSDRNVRQLELLGLCLDIVTGVGCENIPGGMYCRECRRKHLRILQWARDKGFHTFATTNSFGFCTNEIEVGDRIWHFDDTARAYFVCRDLGGCAILVGECFLCEFSYHKCCSNCNSTGIVSEGERCDICRKYWAFKETKLIIS